MNLFEYLKSCTTPVRKGATVIERAPVNGVQVTEVYAFPTKEEALKENPSLVFVDCHFIEIGVDVEKANAGRSILLAWCDTYPDPEKLAGGPSYIEVGGVVGSQDAAFAIFAVGTALELWHVITPARFGFEGAEADEMAGKGFVMMSGYSKKPDPEENARVR